MILENSKVIIDIDSCTKCKTCADECLYYNFESDELGFDERMEENCIECGKCVAICPVNAIRLKIHKDEILQDVPANKNLPTFDSLTNLIKTRRSVRQFKDKPVPKELIEKILAVVGKYSPTGHNQENVYFTVVQDPEILKKLSNECTKQVTNLIKTFEDPQGRKILEKSFSPDMINKIEEIIPFFKQDLKAIKSGREMWRRNAEIIIMHSPNDALTLIENCTLAACHIMLAAETMGLSTCSLGYLNEFFSSFRSVGKIVKLPLKHTAGYTLAIGYPKANYYRIPARKPLKVKWF